MLFIRKKKGRYEGTKVRKERKGKMATSEGWKEWEDELGRKGRKEKGKEQNSRWKEQMKKEGRRGNEG